MSINNEESEHIEGQSVEKQYKSCTQKYENSKKISEFQQLKTEFWSLGDYEHSREYVQLCDSSIRNIKKKRITIGGIAGIGVAIVIVLLFTLVIPTIRYNGAMSDYKMKKYNEAYKTFKDLGGFKDSKFMAEYSDIRRAKEGDIVKFGYLNNDEGYENRDTLFSKEEKHGGIEWRILKVQKDKVLLIAKNITAGIMSYQDDAEDEEHVTWEQCSLRHYLNKQYYNKAFDKEEKNVIADSHLKQKDEPDTTDKVFILSYDELSKYFYDDKDREAKIHNFYDEERLESLYSDPDLDDSIEQKYWMRTHCTEFTEYEYAIKCVNQYGEIDKTQSASVGDRTYNVAGGGMHVRPAIWVNISNK